MLKIARDVEKTCSEDTLILNYSNPMAMNTWASYASSPAKIVGLCHGVQGTVHTLAMHLCIPMEEVDYWCAGSTTWHGS